MVALHAIMNFENFTTIYTLITAAIAFIVLLFRLKGNAAVLASSPVSAEVLSVEKNVDVILQIKVRFKHGSYSSVADVNIDPMYDKTDYQVGSTVNVWVSPSSAAMVFLKKPNVLKLLVKSGYPAFVLLLITWLPLLLIFRGNISM